MKKWWENFEKSQIDFVYTSDAMAYSDSLFLVTNFDSDKNSLSWTFVSNLTQKRIIADTRVGLGGMAESKDLLFVANYRIGFECASQIHRQSIT